MTPTHRLNFEVGAGVIFTLGRDLITDSSQAVMELVKNAYDADSRWAVVSIDTSKPAPDSRYPDCVGHIRIEDGGVGMDRAQISRGWLTIARSEKRSLKQRGETTGLGRTPLGDKGLGRLGAQALGETIEIVSRAKGSDKQVEVWFKWSDFNDEVDLTSVKVACVESPRPVGSKDGTTLTISGLHDADGWLRPGAELDLQRKLARLISPFDQIDGFHVAVKYNGTTLDLLQIVARMRQAAMTRCTFAFDGVNLSVTCSARLEYCRPNPSSREDRDKAHGRFSAYVRSDEGSALFHSLEARLGKKRGKSMPLERAPSPWFAKATVDREFATLPDLTKAPPPPVKPGTKASPPEPPALANPGPFSGEIDYYTLDERLSAGDVLGLDSKLRELFESFQGVRVYRDGFGIRLDDDWLGLARHGTSGRSFQDLKVGNTMGFVALTARENAVIEETADRQRFNEDSAYYKNFRRLLSEVVGQIGTFQNELRQGTTDFLKAQAERAAGVDETMSSDSVAGKLDIFVGDVHRTAGDLRAAQAGITTATKKLDEVARSRKKSRGAKQDDEEKALVEVLEQARAAMSKCDAAISSMSLVLGRADEVVRVREVLLERIDTFTEQAALAHEAIGIGLAAEVLTHEVANIADGLNDRVVALTRSLPPSVSADKTIVSFLEHVRSQVVALRKQLTHLAPSLRYVRERKDIVNLRQFLRELEEYHKDRLERARINLNVRWSASADVSVEINRGKLVQVFDNLILNSEFWVRDALDKRVISRGLIEVVGRGLTATVADNGPGVDVTVEDALFEAFVTRKPKARGRGLGLYIARQLLGSDGCSIVLMEQRNALGRRNTFEIDLTGVSHGGA